MLISLCIFLVGVAFLAVGRHGWPVGHHPTCRNCGFDLYALPAETARCPECGDNIRAENAIRIGQHHPIKSAVAAGILLLLAGGTLLAAHLFTWWPQFDASPYKLTLSLEYDALSPDDLTRSRASAELLRRLRANSVSPLQASRLTDLLLTRQADITAEWIPAWGDLIQAARQDRLLSDDRWRRYLTQSLQLTAQARPRVRMDDPLPFALTCRLRGGSDYQAIRPGRLIPQITASFAGIAVPIHMNPALLDEVPAPAEWNAVWLPAPGAADQPNPTPGPQTLDLTITMTLTDHTGISAATTQHLSLPFELLPRSESSVTLRTSPDLVKEMASAARYRPPRSLREDPAAGIALTPPKTSLGSLWISGPPITAAYLVLLRQDGRDWPLARLMVRPNDAANVPLTLATAIPPLHAGDAEIIALPDTELAPGTVDVLELFGGQMHWPIVIAAPP